MRCGVHLCRLPGDPPRSAWFQSIRLGGLIRVVCLQLRPSRTMPCDRLVHQGRHSTSTVEGHVGRHMRGGWHVGRPRVNGS
ncbi:hypothetical protein SSOG_01112 [Streptomyces himastatinicus ATCC 53653]|uniref:Uncharacterized protein n=1 Tax=Streptomyces himastatinicus ATCC 53653 TaxID=457427 RepID=D9WJH2_9ACTN|nr:hypothetical protein SSOG_01112 [Streptomyces himastatinicus ATCC 53653]